VKKYYKLKQQYKEYVLLFKEGNFYRVYEKDAVIICNLTNYRMINKNSKHGGVHFNWFSNICSSKTSKFISM